MSDRSPTPDRGILEQTLARFRRRHRLAYEPVERLSASAFRAVMDERLRSLERQLDQVKTRVNGLIFLLTGTVAAQLLLRLMA